jgi:hypothetical protein
VSVIGQREATDQKRVEEAEQAQEDLILDDTDPNMVRPHYHAADSVTTED